MQARLIQHETYRNSDCNPTRDSGVLEQAGENILHDPERKDFTPPVKPDAANRA